MRGGLAVATIARWWVRLGLACLACALGCGDDGGGCPEGELGCPCAADDRCSGSDLECVDGTCARQVEDAIRGSDAGADASQTLDDAGPGDDAGPAEDAGGDPPECDAGSAWNGAECADADECADGTNDCDTTPPAMCHDLVGGFECECPAGYIGDGHGEDGCADIDECAENNGGCDPLVECVNSEGSRVCGDCPPYYHGDGESGCTPPWTRQLGSAGDDAALGLAIDGSGAIHLAGRTAADFDGEDQPGTHAGGTDAIVVRLASDGTTDWSAQIGSAVEDLFYGVAVDGAGRVYGVGYTAGVLEGTSNAGLWDIAVSQYDAAGVWQWTRQLGTPGNEFASDVVAEDDGTVYVAGSTTSSLPGNTGAGVLDLFIAKYDATGANAWVRQLGTNTQDQVFGVATDGAGSIYAAGYSNGMLDGVTRVGQGDVVIVKYDADGELQWTRQFGSVADDRAYGVAVDAAGNVYAGGYTNGLLDGTQSAGAADIFVVKYDAAGERQWTRQLGTAGNDRVQALVADASGNVFVTGGTEGDLDGNTSAGGVDAYVAKYDATGAHQWTRQFGSTTDERGYAIALDADGNVYVAGATKGELHGLPLQGGEDVFVVKLDPAGNLL